MTISLFQSMQKAVTAAMNDGTALMESKTHFLGFLFEHDADLETPAVLNISEMDKITSPQQVLRWLPALICMNGMISLKSCAWACIEKDARGRFGCSMVFETRFGTPEGKWYPLNQGKDGWEIAEAASRDAVIPAHCDWFSVLDLPSKEYAHLTLGTPFYQRTAVEPFYPALAARLGLIQPSPENESDEATTARGERDLSTISWFNAAMAISLQVQILLLSVWNQKLRKEIAVTQDMQFTFDMADKGSTVH